MSYYLTILVTMMIINEGDNFPREHQMYIQHKDQYTMGECRQVANNPKTTEVLLSAIREDLCDAFVSIDEVACMTRQAYQEYNRLITGSN